MSIKTQVTLRRLSVTNNLQGDISHGCFFFLLLLCLLGGVLLYPLQAYLCYVPWAHFNRGQQLPLHHLASHPAKRRPRRSGARRLRPQHPHPQFLPRPFSLLVWPDLGPHRLHLHQRQILLRHRRLLLPTRMQRRRRRHSRHSSLADPPPRPK